MQPEVHDGGVPDRAFDVGIAEQHAVTFSAGMATRGLVPFCNIYSSFMQRAYDQVIHDVAFRTSTWCSASTEAGSSGPMDRPTTGVRFGLHACIPNLVVSAPMDEQELRNLMYTSSQKHNGPFVIRYPRGTGSMVEWPTPVEAVEIGRGRRLRNGDDVALLSIGAIGTEVGAAAEKLEAQGVSAAHYDMRFVKPLDEVLLHEVFSRFKDVITIEDGCVQGGMGSAVTEWAMEQGYAAKVVRLGCPTGTSSTAPKPSLRRVRVRRGGDCGQGDRHGPSPRCRKRRRRAPNCLTSELGLVTP